jgi:hypothetical protein
MLRTAPVPIGVTGLALSDYDTANCLSPVTGNIHTNIGAIAAVPTVAAGGVNRKHPLRIVSGALYATVASDRMYVSFPGDDRIEVLDPNATGPLGFRLRVPSRR